MPTGALRILLMEDDPGLARLCQKALERAGHVVDHAADGEQGLAMCETGTYDLLAVDQNMPVYNGIEVIRRLASRGPLPPIVMITGSGNEQIAVEAMKLGAYDYLVKDVDGGYLALLPTVIERALRRRSEDERMRLASAVLENTSEAILVTDVQGTITAANPAFTATTGYAADEVIGKNPRLLQSGRHDAEFYKKMWAALTETGAWQGEIWDRRKNGEPYPAMFAISAVKDPSGQPINYVAMFVDITAHKRAEDRFRYLATHDPLTGLPNRDLFQDRLTQALALAARERRTLVVMLLDLDGFKPVNDSLGHMAGDLVLKGVAERLTECMRDCDTVARLGGDEFTILLPEVANLDGVALCAQRALDAVSEPFAFKGHECRVTASIGIALYPSDGKSHESLVANADAAMYCAKKKKNSYAFFSLPRPSSA